MNEQLLQRSDIVGKRITAVHTSEWKIEDDGYEFCTYAYITLETGVIFSLEMLGENKFPPIRNIAGESFVKEEFTPFSTEWYLGKKILEVVINDVGIQGILLENGYIIYWGMRGITVYGPTVELFKDFDYENFVPYWSEHDFTKPLTYQSVFHKE